ncbi:hypothetical protein VAE151_630680 [Vibrio aestuarianus]|uniref:Uncharacterized protein n=1 Tax=Vibrio aestuarianus TaxID=28171 RepID=A0ABM9FJ22_9VIBR|nr:hypothetical protein VAE063_1010154 [Vibrio aestuarianus]CAH8226509.1 hypothetical protein VIBAE_B10765 [Vibrio aestuarianus subsp. francensis]CAH8223582.1 hypothetical protein VAE308_1270032 [Vibrio aestuarianus]CAH8228259.1 hypothetical protein VAE032_330155 [Vibrio aestuarianus]CAH8228277.1 hypothetical protein VAE128_500673 [Vibrio aestuarianus]
MCGVALSSCVLELICSHYVLYESHMRHYLSKILHKISTEMDNVSEYFVYFRVKKHH